jgi:hypothetical protein
MQGNARCVVSLMSKEFDRRNTDILRVTPLRRHVSSFRQMNFVMDKQVAGRAEQNISHGRIQHE